MKKIALLTTALTLTFFGQTALSFGLPDMPAVPGVGATKSVEAGPLVAQLNEVLLNLSTSQEHIFLAMGDPQAAANAKSRCDELKKKTVNADFIEQTDADNKEAEKEMANSTKLTDEGKKEMALALPPYGKALLRSAGLGATLAAAAQTITTNPMSVVGGTLSAPELITIFTKAPALLGNIVGQGYKLSTYAGKFGIKDPTVPTSSDGKDVGKGSGN